MSRGGVRILGGELRGRRLAVGPGIRPTGARVREALMSIWGPRLAGARILELFAGTGAVGFEALSRGAESVLFIEESPRAAAGLALGCRELAPERAHVLRASLPSGLGRVRAVSFDLVYADPPYRWADHGPLFRALRGHVAGLGEVVFEHSRRADPGELEGWRRTDLRAYGESCLSFYRLIE